MYGSVRGAISDDRPYRDLRTPNWVASGAVVGVNAFHEKAVRSQVGSFAFLLDKLFSLRRVATDAILPSALSMSDWFARCKLGVLVSAGAAT